MTSAESEAAYLAENLARNCGYAVFPCRDDKKPATPHGFKDASNDPDAIAALWRRYPAPLIGIRTGACSGISVLDVDEKHERARLWWRYHQERLLPTRTFRTRGGGLHLYFGDVRGEVRNTQGKLAAGVDTRGAGGYIVYWFAFGCECLDHSPSAAWPSWLLVELNRTPQPTADRHGRTHRTPGDPGLTAIIRRVAIADEGDRNGLLFWAACRCRERRMSRAEIEALLIPAARQSGLPEIEARRTIASAIGRTA